MCAWQPPTGPIRRSVRVTRQSGLWRHHVIPGPQPATAAPALRAAPQHGSSHAQDRHPAARQRPLPRLRREVQPKLRLDKRARAVDRRSAPAQQHGHCNSAAALRGVLPPHASRSDGGHAALEGARVLGGPVARPLVEMDDVVNGGCRGQVGLCVKTSGILKATFSRQGLMKMRLMHYQEHHRRHQAHQEQCIM